MKRLAGLAALTLALAVLWPASVTAKETKLRWGSEVAPVTMYHDPHGGGAYGHCGVGARLWAQELNNSDVWRLRVQFQKRGKNDPGYLPTYQLSGWAYSATFPVDNKSHWARFYVDERLDVITTSGGGQYNLWAKIVGDVKSFWRPDRVLRANLGLIPECDQGFSGGGM